MSSAAESSQPALPDFIEHRIARFSGRLAVRDFTRSSPAFLLLHGFPDNSHIYDFLIPHLVSGGRRVVTIDFLGFGASEKPVGGHELYNFAQQLGDVRTVVEELDLERVVLVGHDAGGPSAVNFVLQHPDKTSGVVLLNAFYGEAPGQMVPEFIELFANPNLRALHQRFAAEPQHFGWLLNFQRDQMQALLSEDQKRRYSSFLGPLIDSNFRQKPSSLPAFIAMTADLHAEERRNNGHLRSLRTTSVPFKLIWGKKDPYLHISCASWLQDQIQGASLTALDTGHWPQIDAPEALAKIMLGGV